jgi:glycosyltransferase involved in cell wall biosynthesis
MAISRNGKASPTGRAHCRPVRLIVATSSYPVRADEAINAGVFVRDVVAQLVHQGHSVYVLTPEKSETIRESPAPVRTFPWGGTESVLTRLNPRRPSGLIQLVRLMVGGRRALRRLALEVRADGVVAMWAIPAGYWTADLPVPHVVWALGSDIWSAHRYPLGAWIVRDVLRGANHVFANSMDLSERVRRIAGCDCEVLLAGRTLPVGAISPVDLAGQGPHFLFIGRWDRVKGVDILLNAMRTVADCLPDAHLHIFGGGPLETEIRSQVQRLALSDAVTLYGYADPGQAVAYLKACSALVIPSRLESLPVLYSDALQCGCPVVTTNVGDLGRVVQVHKTGLVCPPEAPAALAKAMCSIWYGKRDLCGRAGRGGFLV